jgi:hypothetical protein
MLKKIAATAALPRSAGSSAGRCSRTRTRTASTSSSSAMKYREAHFIARDFLNAFVPDADPEQP